MNPEFSLYSGSKLKIENRESKIIPPKTMIHKPIPMHERSGTNGGGEYRYGFNGMESIDEMVGNENGYDFGARMYDGRLGRWWSVDDLVVKYAAFTPYSAFGNNPNLYIDTDGDENIVYLVYIEPKDSKRCRLSKSEKKNIEKAQ